MSSNRQGFGDRLSAAVAARGRLCVGIDPHPGLLEAWGLEVNAKGLAEFSARCVEAFADTVAVVKPQVAFFEAYGSAGYAVLEKALADLHSAGVLTIADAKRGDIGSTMSAYAQAWLSDDSPLACDALTVSPYLGFGSLKPAVDLAQQTGRGLFVLSATSNPEGASVQHAVHPSMAHPHGTSDHGAVLGDNLAQSMVNEAAEVNAAEVAAGAAAGSIGVVVGATLDKPPVLDGLQGAILMPGVGAQGGNAADVRRISGKAAPLALPNISRAILKQGPQVEALRAAIVDEQANFL